MSPDQLSDLAFRHKAGESQNTVTGDPSDQQRLIDWAAAKRGV